MIKRTFVLLASMMLAVWLAPAAHADSVPSGTRTLGQAEIEPAYDAAHAGVFTYLLTPTKAPDPVKANPRAWAPIYVVVYPTSTTAATSFNCMHLPSENCPSHGNLVAGAAAGIMPKVYGNGVVGHDHVLDVPTGDDFNIAWEPVLVLFTSPVFANMHLVTDAAIDEAADAGEVILVPAPNLTFNCSVVSQAIWNRAS